VKSYHSINSDQVRDYVARLNAEAADGKADVVPPVGQVRQCDVDVDKAIAQVCESIEKSVPNQPRGLDADRHEGSWSLPLYRAFVPLGPRVLNDLGFWRSVACERIPRFVIWRDGSKKHGASKEGFGSGSSAAGFQDCVPYRMFRRGQIAALAKVKSMTPEQIAGIEGTDLWRSHVLRIRLGNSPTAAAVFLRLADERRNGKASLTDLVREAAKLVQRLSSNIVFGYLGELDVEVLIKPEFDAALPLAIASRKAKDEVKRAKSESKKTTPKPRRGKASKSSRGKTKK